MAARQVIGNVVFKDRAERKELQQFCKDYFGRSFSAQCRHMLQKARREAREAEKASKPTLRKRAP